MGDKQANYCLNLENLKLKEEICLLKEKLEIFNVATLMVENKSLKQQLANLTVKERYFSRPTYITDDSP